MIGGLLVKFAFAACFISVVAYFLNHKRPQPRLLKIGRVFFHTTVVAVLSTAAYLLYLILSHQFQYTYVWSYSSRELPLSLLISTFYAGQEGSFMLWSMYTALIGVFLLRDSARKGYESEVMSVFGLIELMLLLMLIVKNPFLFVWESFPGQVDAGFTPANGRGLNPLLQNYWMVIHPQVLFSGFSAMGVPYAYAVAALMKRDYRNWIRPATPWLVFGALVLGTGIMMGGFWAYETLGWGGYWGWDPVENSSLVPWLFAIAGIHTVLSQRRTGGFIRLNLMLGMMCFIMVLYSTFLTRSGVLGDTSVHSFVDPGMWAYWLLVSMIVLFVALGAYMLISRWKEIPSARVQHSYYSREFALFLGSTTIVAAAILIIAGTSSPVITDILNGKKSAVDVSYYVHTTLPLGILIALLAGIGQLLWWTRTHTGTFLKSLLLPVILAAVTTSLLALVSSLEPLVALLLFCAALALFANIQVGIRIMRGNPKYAGGSIAHVGLAIMLFGFVASSKYDTKVTISLPQGMPTQAMGYTLTYVGYHPIDNEKFAFKVNVEKDGKRYTVAPVMYYSSYNDGLMRNPDIANLITHDFYLAPLALEQTSDSTQGVVEKLSIRRGEMKKAGDIEITFVDFELPASQRADMLEGKSVLIGAKLMVKAPGKKAQLLIPEKAVGSGDLKDVPVRLGKEYEFTITGMHPDRESRENSAVEIGVRSLAVQAAQHASQPDILVAEASVKPYINLVWSGVIVLLLGFLVTIVRRAGEARQRAMTAQTEGAESLAVEEEQV